MKIRCVWEHNGDDSIMFADNFVGAFTRGNSREMALRKMPTEIKSYLKWTGESVPNSFEITIIQEKQSGLTISDADSDVIFDTEKEKLSLS